MTKIKQDPKNTRLHGEENKELIRKSLEELGAGRSVVIDSEDYLIAGNGVFEQAEKLGIKTRIIESDGSELVVIKRTDLKYDDEKRRGLAVADNATGETSEWNFEELTDEEMAAWEITQEQEEEEVNVANAYEDGFEVAEEIKTDIVNGDVFEFKKGELCHRLICGDSTDRCSVDTVLNGNEPYLMVTDPPYGVEYNPEWRNEAERADGTKIGASAIGEVRNDNNADWTDAWSISPSKVAYVYHADKFSNIVQDSLERCDYEIASQIIWAKSNFAISRGNYHWKHEPCWYACKKGAKRKWIGGHSQTTLWEINKPMKSETGHGTQKPIECMSRPISNHEGDVYDPFLGSGTTMVAAHQIKRNCYGIEIDPKYCQAIVDRMRALDDELVITKNGKPIESK